MSFIIKDTNPQYGGAMYMVGVRPMLDPQGRQCEAADFGTRENAKKFTKAEAEKRAGMLNQVAGRKQFVVEEVSIYGQQYGSRRRANNGFRGFGELPSQEQPAEHGGFRIANGDAYNGF